MLSNLCIKGDEISYSDYFIGTMLFVGDFVDNRNNMIVVDGQQRLTTITILFSVLAQQFHEIGMDGLSKKVFDYIQATDDNGQKVRLLQTSSNYPYFMYFVQDIEKKHRRKPSTEEEKCIEETYNYFLRMTSEKMLSKELSKWLPEGDFSYLDILKALRDQVLNSIFISITTNEKEEANRIFEILNAKGKRLLYIDLIKNQVYDVMNRNNSQIDSDGAILIWNGIVDRLNSGKETIGMATFFRHYWVSKYNKQTATKLFDSFNKRIKKNVESYSEFLDDLDKNSNIYMKIVNPALTDYNDRKEYKWLVDSLKTFNNVFLLTQTRIALLSLFDAKERDVISQKKFKEAVIFMENFHFAYTAICSKRANQLDNIYSNFAISLRKSTDKQQTNKILEEQLYDSLNKIYPTFDEFNAKFINLSYSKDSKQDKQENMKTKYAINKLSEYFEECDHFDSDGSVEHIYPEGSGSTKSINIGNLILLELNLNNKASELSYNDKKEIYNDSKYTWVKKFMNLHPNWSESDINERAKELSKYYYENIICKKID